MGVDLLTVAKSGLFASKKALETTGHNISNANTEGYSRQRVQQQSNTPIGEGRLVHGSGVRVTKIQRIHDEHVAKRLNNSLTEHHFFKERANQLGQVEEIFNEINTDGLHLLINKFFNSFRDLANQPENETTRSVVRENAKMITADFRRIRGMLDSSTNQIDQNLLANTQEVNQLLHEVANLNKEINLLEFSHSETGDLRDQRDFAVQRLAEFFEIQTYVDDKSRLIVNAVGVGTLVSGTHVSEIMASKTEGGKTSNDVAGSVEIYLKGKQSTPISMRFGNGILKGLLETRNNEIKKLQREIDELAFHTANTVNAIHRKGFTNHKVPLGPDGQPNPNAIANKISGINFFKIPTQIERAAEYIDLSLEVKDDLKNIVTALAPNRPGDNRVAIAISKLQHEKILDGGTTTLEEKYLQSIGDIGLSSGKANLDTEHSLGILTQSKALRERISGVSIDEEAANMVKFQQAYDASARMIKAADETFKSVLSIMP